MIAVAYRGCGVSSTGLSPPYAFPTDLLSSAWVISNNLNVGVLKEHGDRTLCKFQIMVTDGGQVRSTTIGADTDLGPGVPHQNAMLASMAGL